MNSTGCGGPATIANTEKDRLTFEGITLKVACPGELPGQVVKRFAPGWSRSSGAKVEVKVLDAGAAPDTTGPADIWIIRPWQLGHWAGGGELAPLPDSFTKRESASWTTLFTPFRDHILHWGRPAHAVPVIVESPLCFYRKDLFAEAKLDPPLSWEELEKVAAYFHDHPPQGFGATCLPPLPSDADALDREFFTIAASMVRLANHEVQRIPAIEAEAFSFHYDTATGKPRIAGAGFIQALTYLQRMNKLRIKEPSASPEEAFRDGHAVWCLADASWIVKFQKSPAIAGKFGIAPTPGAEVVLDYQGEPKKQNRPNRVPYLGAAGWVAVVLKSSTHQNAAFAFLEDLNSIETGRQIVSNTGWGSGAFREEHLAKPEIWNSYGLSVEQRARFLDEMKQTLACPGLKNPAFRLRTPDEQLHQRILIEQLRAALFGEKDAAEALREVEKRWDALDQAVPEKERRTQYLRSLELNP